VEFFKDIVFALQQGSMRNVFIRAVALHGKDGIFMAVLPFVPENFLPLLDFSHLKYPVIYW
jgi:hypothetical protein